MNATATVIVVLVGVVVVYEILIKPQQQTQGLFGNFNLGSLFTGGGGAGRTTIPNTDSSSNSSSSSSATSTGDFFD